MNCGLPLTSSKSLYSGAARVALAAGVGARLRVVARVVRVLVVDEAERRGALALHVPHVARSRLRSRCTCCRRACLRRGGTCARAAILVEALDRVADGPDHGPLVLVVDVVVAALVGRVGASSTSRRPASGTGRAARMRRVGVLDQHVQHVGRSRLLSAWPWCCPLPPKFAPPGEIDRYRFRIGPGGVGRTSRQAGSSCCIDCDERRGCSRSLRGCVPAHGERRQREGGRGKSKFHGLASFLKLNCRIRQERTEATLTSCLRLCAGERVDTDHRLLWNRVTLPV